MRDLVLPPAVVLQGRLDSSAGSADNFKDGTAPSPTSRSPLPERQLSWPDATAHLLIVFLSATDQPLDVLSLDFEAHRSSSPDLDWHVLLIHQAPSSAVHAANRTNEAVVFAHYLDHMRNVYGVQHHGEWGSCPVGLGNTLLAIHPAFPAHQAPGLFQRALQNTDTPSLPAVAELPSLPLLRDALVKGRDEFFLSDVEQRLRALIVSVSSTAKLQRTKISGLLAVLHYARSEVLLPGLEASLCESLETLRSVRRTSWGGQSLREIDSCLHLAFELCPLDQGHWFASLADTVVDCAAEPGSEWPTLCRGLRQSFMKGIGFMRLGNGLQRLALHTSGDDALSFRLIAAVFASGDLPGMALTIDENIPHRILGLSPDAVGGLARDLRRSIPVRRHLVQNLHTVFCAAFENQLLKRESGATAELWLARCMVAIYVCGPMPGFLGWLQIHYERLGLDHNQCKSLFAVAGYDIPYILQLNKFMLAHSLRYTILAPSSQATIEEYMRAMLESWQRQALECVWPPTAKIPSVSVVMTTFAPREELFSMSLLSMCMQVDVHIEIIVVDDCSPTDSSLLIERTVRKLAADTGVAMRYIRNEVNLGQYQSRNIAIAMATGEFIAIQDDDDISHPERLRYQLAAMLERPQIKATCALHLRMSEGSRLMADGGVVGAIEGDAPVSFVWRKAVFTEVGTFLPTRTRGDIEFRARMIRRYTDDAILVLPTPLVYMRGGMGTVSSDREYSCRSALSALRYMMDHSPTGDALVRHAHRWIPRQLRS